VKQDNRIELLELCGKRVLGGLRDGGMGLHALERCQRRVIALRHAGPVAGLFHQLERGLEEVHVGPHIAIDVPSRMITLTLAVGPFLLQDGF